MDNRPIGVMDSGIGGLSIVRVLMQELPHESIIFVGDQLHFPYGTRTTENIRDLALKISQYLVAQNVKLLVIACNTATAAALPILQAQLPIPVIGVIEPGARAAIEVAQTPRIGVIATDSTIRSQAYSQALHRLVPETNVVSQATQPLVSVVEHGLTGTFQAQQMVNNALAIFKEQPVSALILGCTHFPFLEYEIHHCLGKEVVLIDPAEETVKMVHSQLAQNDQLADQIDPQSTFYSTGDQLELLAGVNRWVNPQAKYQCAHLNL
ncbi:Glutamate racemase [Limosilactobacillus gastricus PS3]|uniref:Glutamate racemase n=1 Tax=Limosilactobacillus gastricus PS3 TaxID=1144300 RepID=H4GJD1_9LACO|nr:glutamate racemase [Limosilactobacillus gastricus]EHS86972.1 Glutamate racemase [Limosilactobacillus gastricus PS3]